MGKHEDPAEKNGHKPDKPIPPPNKDDKGDGKRGSDRLMGGVMQHVEALIERLTAAGWLTQNRVRTALHDVPRHVFAPPVA